ncbi:hypothetical protein [Bartonella machadoae]|uniref:hypothetical protein n=1 Tax=Bartonella machadoae TaxID=2893471 RepID=UPI001F4CE975|nr:hypothetical protein [Bartonella machadoae]UNE53859.1 hypothetical protein LNM86_09685 [Bartonella machadoae]
MTTIHFLSGWIPLVDEKWLFLLRLLARIDWSLQRSMGARSLYVTFIMRGCPPLKRSGTLSKIMTPDPRL